MNTAELAKAQLKNLSQYPKTFSGMNSHQIKGILDLYRLQISTILPKGTSIDRYMQMITTMIANNPKIGNCTISSVIGATILAATLDFDPSPELGYCYFVPFYNSSTDHFEVSFIIGYRGIVELAYRSGVINLIYSHVVYENDKFEVELGLHRDIRHIPNYREPGNEIVAAYAVYFTKANQFDFLVLSKKDIQYAQQRSRSSSSVDSPWNQPDSRVTMIKKTAVKKLLKLVPISISDRRVLAVDDSAIPVEALKLGGIIDLSKVETDQSENGNEDHNRDAFVMERKQQNDEKLNEEIDSLIQKLTKEGVDLTDLFKAKGIDGSKLNELPKERKIELLWDMKNMTK